MKKSVSTFVNGRQIAMCMRDDVEIVLPARKNHQRKPLPVAVDVMYNHIITAKGRYNE